MVEGASLIDLAVAVALGLGAALFLCLGAAFRIHIHHDALALAALLGGYLFLGATPAAILYTITLPASLGIILSWFCIRRPPEKDAAWLRRLPFHGDAAPNHGPAADSLLAPKLRTISAYWNLALLLIIALAVALPLTLALSSEAVHQTAASLGVALPAAAYGEDQAQLPISVGLLFLIALLATRAARCPHCGGALLTSFRSHARLFTLRQCPYCSRLRSYSAVDWSHVDWIHPATTPSQARVNIQPLPETIAITYTTRREEGRWKRRAIWKFKPITLILFCLVFGGFFIACVIGQAAQDADLYWVPFSIIALGPLVALFSANGIISTTITYVFDQKGIFINGILGRQYLEDLSPTTKVVSYAGGLLVFSGNLFPLMLPPAALRNTDIETLYRFLADKGITVKQAGN